MTLQRRLRVLWERYVAPSRRERDPAFRDVLDAATVRGLRVAGLFGIAALGGAAVAAIVTGLLAGDGMMSSTRQIAEVLSDKLLILAASAVFLLVARFRPGLRTGRWVLGLYVVVAAAFLLGDDVVRRDTEFLAAWLTLLLFLTVGTVPFQPVHTLAFGVLLTVAHTLVTAVYGETTGLDDGETVRRLSYLVLATFLATAMNGALYAGRYAQHQVAARVSRLRDRLRRRSQLLEARGAELEAKSAELAASLERLERAQGQLVRQEKMASLGQLTAGVAHELKNPLNFVNNFAQLSVELLDDLEAELREDETRPVGAALEESEDLLESLRANAAKIQEHGRRADGIIRSMLAHSRAQPGPRRAAPLNRLLEEYVGLAYHGMRAEHSGFHVDIETDFDPEAGEVEMVPEEMGRVFLNLLDNALQAVRTRAEEEGPGYRPRLGVRTRRRSGGAVAVRIEDNGPGIPEAARERIFEPFFTTKPTGEGTGLGLSMTYEIVVHGHGGDVELETEEGEGTAFTVILPTAGDGAGAVASPPEAAEAGSG